MFDEKILAMIKNKTLFMGTANDNVPRVRPMRPFVGQDHSIWLISYADTEKTKEIQNNQQVELCTINDNHDVLRLQGLLLMEKELDKTEVQAVRQQIFATVANIADFFTGADDVNMAIYKFQVNNIIFRILETAERPELNFPPSK
jgi:general stress protein 26